MTNNNNNCKCAHAKDEHDKFLLDHNHCTMCQCSKYLDHRFPRFVDMMSLVMIIGLIGIIALSAVGVWFAVDVIITTTDDVVGTEEPLNGISIHGLLTVIMKVVIGFFVIVIILLLSEIVGYLKQRRREDFVE